MIPDALVQVLYSATQIHRQQLTLEQRRVELKALEMQIDYRTDRMEAHASLQRDLIRSLIDRRIDATTAGFNSVLKLYETQNNNYVEQQAKLIDAKINAVDPLVRANLDATFKDIAIELEKLQFSGRSLFQDMNLMLLAIGGTALVPTTGFQQTLTLERGTPS